MLTNSGQVFALGQTGNRLFQLAFAYTSKSCKTLDVTFLSESSDSLELQQFASLSHQLGVEIIRNQRLKRIHRTLHNVCIRFGSRKRDGQLNSIIRKLLQNSYIKFASRDYADFRLVIANGSGDIPLEPNVKKFAVLGYIQNANLLRDYEIREVFGRAIEESISPGIQNNMEGISRNIVLLQVRLGDYLIDSKIGACQPAYYSSALKSIDLEIGIEQIHLFSNDPDLALTFIPIEFRQKVIIVGNESDTPLEIINRMRNYSLYVISNSTFGWWGAYLSKHENPIVYVPKPWFRQLDEPLGLVPDTWRRFASEVDYD